jgi:hypothetical protein
MGTRLTGRELGVHCWFLLSASISETQEPPQGGPKSLCPLYRFLVAICLSFPVTLPLSPIFFASYNQGIPGPNLHFLSHVLINVKEMKLRNSCNWKRTGENGDGGKVLSRELEFSKISGLEKVLVKKRWP